MKNFIDFIFIRGGASVCIVTSKLLENMQSFCLFKSGHSHNNFFIRCAINNVRFKIWKYANK